MSFLEQLDELFKLHYVAKQWDHGIRERNQGSGWRAFAPSKFVYAYFVFNSLYSIDWESSVRNETLTDLNRGDSEEFDKIQAMANFVGINRFNLSLPEYIKGHLDMSVEEATEELRNAEIANHFKATFNKVMGGQDVSNSVESMLRFVYRVRNNVFHGTKRILHMEENGQSNRLKIYAAILLAVNELLFDAVAERFPQWNKSRVLHDQELH